MARKAKSVPKKPEPPPPPPLSPEELRANAIKDLMLKRVAREKERRVSLNRLVPTPPTPSSASSTTAARSFASAA